MSTGTALGVLPVRPLPRWGWSAVFGAQLFYQGLWQIRGFSPGGIGKTNRDNIKRTDADRPFYVRCILFFAVPKVQLDKDAGRGHGHAGAVAGIVQPIESGVRKNTSQRGALGRLCWGHYSTGWTNCKKMEGIFSWFVCGFCIQSAKYRQMRPGTR